MNVGEGVGMTRIVGETVSEHEAVCGREYGLRIHPIPQCLTLRNRITARL